MAEAQGITRKIAAPALSTRLGWPFLVGLGLTGAFTAMFGLSLAVSTITGVGAWGVNSPYVWGFDLINYAWWIGVANGASLFAAILVLRKHGLQTSVNRFAEGIALFAVVCAGIFPIIHLGRPWLFYWMFPYPATFQVWPQFRSTLTWDFWAISTHVVVTTLLWYVGLIPDLATLRDKARHLWQAKIYGIGALGWRNSLRHWAYHQVAYRTVAVTVLPLILMMQSTVAFEFATTLVPGWHDTRLPFHYVATGLAQGLSVVLLAAGVLRSGLGLKGVINDSDMDLLGKLVLAAALVTGYLYVSEIGYAFLAEPAAREARLARITGHTAPFAVAAFALAVLIPQILWLRALRLSTFGAVVAGLSVNVGIWCDRYSLLIGGLERLHLPSMTRTFTPSWTEWGLLFGSAGFFALMLLLFARTLPVVAMFEARHDEAKEEGA